jgi:exopolyphosphatase / guanosine-5'-triphosphate,3'-diphosphate pyrophosphatase
MRLAVIDLGTNTFNLLVAEKKHDKVKILFNEKEPVKLGEGGINSGIIKSKAYQRGIIAFEKWVSVAKKLEAEKIYALATSAVRSAQNGKEFTSEIYKKTGIKVHIINGEQEAALIFNGVLKACPLGLENVLVMDIGGGSTEFIIGNKNGILWKKSYQLGVARLLEKFNPHEPIQTKEINAIEQYLKENLSGLWNAIEKFKCKILIGSSGSFDTFADLILQSRKPIGILGNKKKFTFNLEDFFGIHQQLLAKTKAQRMKMPGMLEMRVDMIVLASLCCSLVLKTSGIKKMKLSTFSLKEGAFYEIIDKQTQTNKS